MADVPTALVDRCPGCGAHTTEPTCPSCGAGHALRYELEEANVGRVEAWGALVGAVIATLATAWWISHALAAWGSTFFLIVVLTGIAVSTAWALRKLRAPRTDLWVAVGPDARGTFSVTGDDAALLRSLPVPK